jgi:hypothetical protein
MKKLIFLFLLLINNISLAGTIDPDTPDEKYIEFGKKFNFVVKIRSDFEKNGEIYNSSASAVLIGPHWALTAAHVVEGTKNSEIIIGDCEEKTCKHYLLTVIKHKDYNDDVHGRYDIALCYSEKDFGLDFYPKLYKKDDELGKTATISGFGMKGTFKTGAQEGDRKRRAGSNKISGSERAVIVCDPSTTGKTALEFMITPGDSGGGLFIENELAGINSFLMATDGKANGTYGDESAFTRISLYSDWITNNIDQHEKIVAKNKKTDDVIVVIKE